MGLVDWRELYASNRAVIERAGGGRSHGSPAAVRSAPNPGTWEERTFTAAGRTRRALVHTPASIQETAVPLVCVLHGCTQDAAGFAAATRMNHAADRHGFIAVYPQQQRGENPRCCWNWFEPQHQTRGAGEPASIAGVIREVIGTTSPWTVDTRRVFVAGLSAGGAMAAILAVTYPDLFAAVAVHSGLAYASANSVGDAFSAMARGSGDAVARGRAAHAAMGDRARPVPSIVVHGSADHTVAPVNGTQVLEQSMAANRLAAPETCDCEITRPTASSRGQIGGGYPYTQSRWTDRGGALMHELVEVEGLGHAWSGGLPGGSFTDPRGPDATDAICRFFADATTNTPLG
ncbi:MAG TPA: PHB depolymerase family esterase [Solirubrobacteraceae bacterium]|nr:PHB depolymerase family esterase [Solirubrobacteraceae bacterium]